jgi:hypothetical protein
MDGEFLLRFELLVEAAVSEPGGLHHFIQANAVETVLFALLLQPSSTLLIVQRTHRFL